MQLIRPMAVDATAFASSNVVETAPAAYTGGTTYALGNTVGVATGTALAVYTSVQNANTGHAPASSPTWWKLTGNTYAVYTGGTTYAAGDIVIDPTAHRTYKSLQGANTGNSLTAVGSTWWLDIGATNKWAMFDGVVGAQTSNPDSLLVGILTSTRIDTVAVLNVSAATLTVTMTDPTDGVVFNQTASLVADSGIDDWYAYFTEPVARLADYAMAGLPAFYSGATVSIELDDTGFTPACGECVLGLSRDIGDTQMGASVGIQDFSVKQADEFGNYTIVERSFSKTGSFEVVVPNSIVDLTEQLLSRYRATPIVYQGSDLYNSTLIYGFFKDFTIQIQYFDYSICTIDIEGLT